MVGHETGTQYCAPVFRYIGVKEKLLIALLLLLPVAALGQTKKSEPLFNQAVEKSIVGQYEEAIALLHKAIKVDPTYAEAYLLLGNQHLLLEQ